MVGYNVEPSDRVECSRLLAVVTLDISGAEYGDYSVVLNV
jgi:hypothetical protein